MASGFIKHVKTIENPAISRSTRYAAFSAFVLVNR